MDQISTELVAKSIGFHGQPLQKIWEGERGENDLIRIGVINPDYQAYQSRQKHFSFQDRAKRLKLHQFIAKKANELFNARLLITPDFSSSKKTTESASEAIFCAVTPPYDSLFNDKLDKAQRLKQLFLVIKPGDIVYGTVLQKVNTGMYIKVLCTGGPYVKLLHDLNAKVYISNIETIPVNTANVNKQYNKGDPVCCQVIDTVDSERIMCSMRGTHPKVQFGYIPLENLPEIYKSAIDTKKNQLSYEQILESSSGFHNPHCIDYLSKEVGLDINHFYTNMSGLRGRFPPQEYSTDLRQVQASKWAFRSVAEGIEHFKDGRHSEAFQCLNKALNIDPRNVEGLVARGALYANSGSFKKAVDDFETALKLNPSHANARKYMGETLVALGRSYEEENKIEDAKKAYQDCLDIIPRHEEAQNSLDFLWSKTSGVPGGGKQLIEPNELTLPALNLKIAEQNREPSASASNAKKDSDSRKDKKNKKKKSKNRKRRSTSSTSSSDSSDSSESSSGSSSSSDSSSSTDSEHKKKQRRSRADKNRPKSLSPLSKRMALMAGGGDMTGGDLYNFNQPYSTGGGVAPSTSNEPDEYELRVRKFLELTRDEENYEEKVRKFVEEAAKYRKDRKNSSNNDEKANKKKDKRKARKMKKESKKKRKEKKTKSGKKDKDELADLGNMEFHEALKIFKSLPVFDMATKAGVKDVAGFGSADKLYGGNQKESAASSRSNDNKSASKSSNNYDKEDENKWKMMFSKDDRKNSMATSVSTAAAASKPIPKQYAFGNEDDSDNEMNSYVGMAGGRQALLAMDKKKQRPPTPPQAVRPKYTEPVVPKPVTRQAVLDKFGNFRLPSTEKPPEPPAPPRGRGSRSRSRSRRRYSSDSRSRSRSQRRRTSRSRSYGRRRSRSRSRSYNKSRSGSRNRSYSRSRSRSGSMDRRRRMRGGRGGYNDRGTYYKPRFGFGNGRGRGGGGNGGGRGGFRDYRDFRGGRGGNDRFRGGWVNRGGNNRFRNYRDGSRERRFDRRSRSRSYDSDDRNKRSPPIDDRKHSDNETNEKSSASKRDRKSSPRPPPSAPPSGSSGNKDNYDNDNGISGKQKSGTNDASLEEIEKVIEKAKKENKEDMLERNKDIVKKTGTW